MNKYLLHFFTLTCSILFSLGQVPAPESEGVSPEITSPILPPSPTEGVVENDPEVELPVSPLSDPNELALIDGLDEEFQVLKLRDQDTNMILDMIQMITGRYILRPQNLPQVKITFDSMESLTRRETLLAVESLLSMNGVAITKIDNKFYKAVPAQGVNVHVPIWLDGPASLIKPSQSIYIKLYNLDYTPVEKMREILNSFATPNVSSLLAFPHANSLMITDALINLQRMEKIIEVTDKPSTESDMDFEIFSHDLNHSNSSDFLTTALGPLIKEGGLLANSFQVKPQFIPFEEAKNLTIISHKKDMSLLKKIIKELDVAPLVAEDDQPGSALFPLYHADAEQVAQILTQIINASNQTKNISKRQSPGTPSTSKQSAPLTSPGSSDSTPTGTFSEYAQVISDPRSNGIFVHGLKKDIIEAEDVIKKLDKPLPMAHIDTIFVMVDISEGSSSGLDSFFRGFQWTESGTTESTYTQPGPDQRPGTDDDVTVREVTQGNKTLDGVLQVPLLESAIPFQLQQWKLSSIKWDQIFSLASERNDVRIFSTPSLTVIHGGKGTENKTGDRNKIAIKDTRYVGITSIYDTRGSSDSSAGIREIEAKTEMIIKNPRIKLKDENKAEGRGTIFMSVEVSAEKFDEANTNVYNGQNLPGKKTRTASTDLAVNDKEIMVLGGLREIQLNRSESKYNLLSDIPYLGKKFFSPKAVKYTPTELIIFIRPRLFNPVNNDDNLANSNRNTLILDQTMKKSYIPTFSSPSKKSLGIPNMAQPAVQDNKSLTPSLLD